MLRSWKLQISKVICKVKCGRIILKNIRKKFFVWTPGSLLNQNWHHSWPYKPPFYSLFKVNSCLLCPKRSLKENPGFTCKYYTVITFLFKFISLNYFVRYVCLELFTYDFFFIRINNSIHTVQHSLNTYNEPTFVFNNCLGLKYKEMYTLV